MQSKIRICGGSASSKGSDYWINKNPKSPYYMEWMIGNESTGVDSRGTPGLTPYVGENGNWWVGETDTGVPASGTVDMPSPQTDTDIFE